MLITLLKCCNATRCNVNFKHKTALLVSGYESLSLWLFGFYGISTFVGYLMPNPFL